MSSTATSFQQVDRDVIDEEIKPKIRSTINRNGKVKNVSIAGISTTFFVAGKSTVSDAFAERVIKGRLGALKRKDDTLMRLKKKLDERKA